MDSKGRFKSRKGQWRRRVMSQITNIFITVKLMQDDRNNPLHQQAAYEQTMQLAAFMMQGRALDRDRQELDFLEIVTHDIRMVMTIIELLSVAYQRMAMTAGYDGKMMTISVVPWNKETWNVNLTYNSWTNHTRQQWIALSSKIKRIL